VDDEDSLEPERETVLNKVILVRLAAMAVLELAHLGGLREREAVQVFQHGNAADLGSLIVHQRLPKEPQPKIQLVVGDLVRIKIACLEVEDRRATLGGGRGRGDAVKDA